MVKQFPIRKKNISFSLSNYSDSEYTSSDDKVNVQPKNTIRSIKAPEERPKSQREKIPKNTIFLFENDKDGSPITKQRSSASFLSDDENLGDPSNHISTFITPKKITRKSDRPFPRNEKPDMIKRKEELQPHIQTQQPDNENDTQDQQDTVRRKKRKKVPKRNINQADIKDKSATIVVDRTQSYQPEHTSLSKTQPTQRQVQRSQSPPPQSQSPPPPQTPSNQQQQKPKSQQSLIQPPSKQQNQPQPPQTQITFSQTQSSQNKPPQNQQQQRIQQLQQRQLQMQRIQARNLQNQQNQQNKKQNEPLSDQESDQNDSTSSNLSLSKTAPPRQRYNSSSNAPVKADIGADIALRHKQSNDTNTTRAFYKPNYQAFVRTPRPEDKNTSSTTEAESADEDITIPRKRKKSRKPAKLSVSEPTYITFYYSPADEVTEPPPGELIGHFNDGPIKPFPGFQTPKINRAPSGPPLPPKNRKPNRLPNLPIPTVQPKQAPFSSRPIPSPKLVEKIENKFNDNLPIQIHQQTATGHSKSGPDEDEYVRSEYDSETSEIQLNGSGGNSGKLNKTFMSAAVFNDLSEQYKMSNEEKQQAFENTLEMQTSALTFHRVPTLSVFEQNANISIANKSEILHNPQVAFSKMFFDLNQNDDEQDEIETETEIEFENDESIQTDYNNIKLDCNSPLSPLCQQPQNDDGENEVNYDNYVNNVYPARRKTKSSRRKSSNLTLEEMKKLIANKDTTPEFKTLEEKFRPLVDEKDQSMGNQIKPQNNLVLYNLTSTCQPEENDITIYEQEGFYCIETITPEAFLSFKFGSQITEPNPDHLHIFTWHNLHIKPMDILDSLLKVVSKIEANDDGINQTKSIIQYVFIWIYLFAVDFYGNIEITNFLRKVLNVVLEKSKNFESNSIIANDVCFMKACLDSLSQKNSKPESYTVPMMKPQKISLNGLRSIRLKDLKVEPSVLVKHFTFIELELFRKINRSEIIIQVSSKFENKEQKDKMMPNYTKYYERFNKTAVFIAMSILVKESRNRAKRIEYWIKVMDEAKKFRNYFLLYEIDAALSCFPINRLEKSWKKTGKKFIALFNDLHSITNPTSTAIIAYKKEVNRLPTYTMPYIGPFLTELRYIYEGKKLLIQMPNGKDGYNMKYHRAFCNVIEQIFQEWGTKIDFQIDNYLLDLCVKLEGTEKKTEDLMPDSIKYEPPNTS